MKILIPPLNVAEVSYTFSKTKCGNEHDLTESYVITNSLHTFGLVHNVWIYLFLCHILQIVGGIMPNKTPTLDCMSDFFQIKCSFTSL